MLKDVLKNIMFWTIIVLIMVNVVEAFHIRKLDEIILDQQMYIEMAPCEGDKQ